MYIQKSTKDQRVHQNRKFQCFLSHRNLRLNQQSSICRKCSFGKQYFSFQFSGQINEVLLFLHDDHYCGGTNIYIEIVQNGTFCITQTQNIFRGTSASWTGFQLSSCFGKDFNVWQDNLYFRTKTTATNDFCPRNLTITLNNAKYQSDIMTDWVDNEKGGELRTTRKILGLY